MFKKHGSESQAIKLHEILRFEVIRHDFSNLSEPNADGFSTWIHGKIITFLIHYPTCYILGLGPKIVLKNLGLNLKI